MYILQLTRAALYTFILNIQESFAESSEICVFRIKIYNRYLTVYSSYSSGDTYMVLGT